MVMVDLPMRPRNEGWKYQYGEIKGVCLVPRPEAAQRPRRGTSEEAPMTPSSSLDKAVLAAVKNHGNCLHDIHWAVAYRQRSRVTPRAVSLAIRRLRRQGAIKFDRKKGWTVIK